MVDVTYEDYQDLVRKLSLANERVRDFQERVSGRDARIAALEAQLAERVDDAEALSRTGAVKVKALGDWRRGYCDDEVTIEQVSTGFGSIYQVRIFEGTIWLDYPVREKEAFPTVEAAKAAAQADYERRILSAIEATPAPMVTFLGCVVSLNGTKISMAFETDKDAQTVFRLIEHNIDSTASEAK